MNGAFKVEKIKVSLKAIDPESPKGLNRDEIEAKTEKLGERIAELADLLFAAGQTPFLLVLQGMDTSGKDGTIRFLMRHLNAQSVRVESFKVPTPEELSHDFLWRCHKVTPGKGEIVIFNRSHYEDVLVVRVHNLAPEALLNVRNTHIANWESMLAAHGTKIIKCFLHISKEEQEKRLLEREEDVTKAWKLSPGDWKEREFWDDYQTAYERALGPTSTEECPWFVIPANDKWYRNYFIAEIIVNALEPLEKEWMARLEKIGTEAKAALAEYRKGLKK